MNESSVRGGSGGRGVLPGNLRSGLRRFYCRTGCGGIVTPPWKPRSAHS